VVHAARISRAGSAAAPMTVVVPGRDTPQQFSEALCSAKRTSGARRRISPARSPARWSSTARRSTLSERSGKIHQHEPRPPGRSVKRIVFDTGTEAPLVQARAQLGNEKAPVENVVASVFTAVY